MATISFCAIVKNEETYIRQCLNSVKSLVQEMVVLDTGSTDRTVEIARETGAIVYNFPWIDDFSVARNEALKYVFGDWVLVLDADEVLKAEVIPQIKTAIVDNNHLVINLIRHEIGAVQSPYSQLSRLFRRHPQIKFSRPYHAIIDDSVSEILRQESHWQIINIPDVGILHYGYKEETIFALNKYERAQEAMQIYLENHPNDPYVCSKLGALYLNVGKAEEGIKLLKRGLKTNQAEPPVLYELYYSLGNAYHRQEDINKAAKFYQKALDQPILPILKLGAYNNLGNLFKNAEVLDLAEKSYRKVLELDPNFAVGYYNLGMTLKALNRLTEAIVAYQQAIKIDPQFAYAYQNLAVALYKANKLQESLEAFNKAILLHSFQNPSEAKKLREALQEMGYMENELK